MGESQLKGDHLRQFADAAASYCAWCQSETKSELEEARAAHRQLSSNYLLALNLRDVEDAPDVDSERMSDTAWRLAYERFGALPFNHDSSVFDPRSVRTGEPEVVTGDLAGDLADIYRDLSAGRVMSTNWAVA